MSAGNPEVDLIVPVVAQQPERGLDPVQGWSRRDGLRPCRYIPAMRRFVIGSFLAGAALAPASASAAGDSVSDDAQAFHDTWDAMLEVDTLSYIKVVESNIPNLASGSTIQTGTYQLSTNTGIGSFVIEPLKAVDELLEMPIPGSDGVSFEEAMELIGGQQFEYRLVDEVFWQGIPRPDGFAWMGGAVDDVPVPVAGAFDGVALFDGAFSSADLSVVRQLPDDNGGTRWIVQVDSDLVGPLGAQSGTNQRLLDAGFDGETDGWTQVIVDVDEAGLVHHVGAYLNGWWIDAVSEIDARAEEFLEGIDVHIDVRFTVPEKPLEVVAPCMDPTTETLEGIETLVCVLPRERRTSRFRRGLHPGTEKNTLVVVRRPSAR